MYRYFNFLFFILILNYLKFSNGYSLIDSDYNCYYNIFNKLYPSESSKQLFFSYNGTSYDFCGTSSTNILTNKCNILSQLQYITIDMSTSSNNALILANDFNCFKNATYFTFNSLTFENNFITKSFSYGKNTGGIQFLGYNSPSLLQFGKGPFPNIYQLLLQTKFSNINTSYYLSDIVTLSHFTIYDINNVYTNSNFIEIVYDNPNQVGGGLLYFNAAVSTFPTLKNIRITSCILSLLPNFQVSSFNDTQLSYIVYPQEFMVFDYSNQIFTFPNLPVNSSFSLISFGIRFKKPQNYISFPNIKTLKELYINKVGPDFQIDNNIPIVNLPPLLTFSFSGCFNLSLPSFDSFNQTSDAFRLYLSNNSFVGQLPVYKKTKLGTLHLELNKFTGTLDKSYCMIQSLYIFNNSLSGPIPSCFLCHNRSFKRSIFDGNNFTNLNDSCTSIILNFVYLGNNVYSLFGEDIGFSTSDFNIYFNNTLLKITTPNSVVPNYNITFTLPSGNYQYLNVRYLLPTLYSFNVTVNNAISPEITNIESTDNNKGGFIIYGNYFSNNKSALSVKIDNYICNIQSSTFNTISCQINGYDELSRNLSTTVKMVDRVSDAYIIDPVPVSEHYSASINVDNTNNNATIRGWFGDINYKLSVELGDKNCKVEFINKTTIFCTIDQGGSGIVPLIITENSFTWIGKDYYEYPQKTISCLNDCIDSNHGTCDKSTGICQCKSSYSGLDCGSFNNAVENGNQDIPKSNITINQNSSSVSINNEKTNFEISIIKLIESDLAGNTIREFQLKKDWTLYDSNNNVWIFNQTISNQTVIVYQIEKFDKQESIQFAGVNFTLEKNSIKTRIDIINYTYLSVLNSIQLIYETVVNDLPNSQPVKECNIQKTEINSDSPNNIIIKKDNKVFYSRFINRVLSDQVPTYMNTKILDQSNSTITLMLSLPHCTNCTIDPDYSVLVSSDFKSVCDGKSSKGYIIPVSIIVPIVSIAIITGTVLYIKKRKSEKHFHNKLKSLANNKN